MIKLKEALVENLKKLDSENNESHIGLSTGFKSLDRLIRLRPGQLVVIGGRPGMGKSALALQWAFAAAKESAKPVIYFSYEMTYAEISMRLLSSEARVDGRKLKIKEFEDKDLIAISGAVQRLASLPFYIEDKGATYYHDIREACIKLKAESGLSMVVVDYVQLMPTDFKCKSRGEEMDRLSTALKELAVELEVPVIVLSQLMRPKVEIDKRPQLEDLKIQGSAGGVEETILGKLADVICLIYREDYYDANSSRKGIAEIIISRNRDGEPGTVEVKWDGPQLRFSDYNED